MNNLELASIYLAVAVGIFYAAILPYYQKRDEYLAHGLGAIAFAKKYMVTIIVNLILNGFVAVFAIDSFLQTIPMTAAITIGVLFAAFIWGAQSQKMVNIVADYVHNQVQQPAPAVKIPIQSPPTPPTPPPQTPPPTG